MHPACLFQYAKRPNLFSLKFGHTKNRFHYFMPRFSQSTTQEFQETMKAKQRVRSFVNNSLKKKYGGRISNDMREVVAEYVSMYRGDAKQKDGISGGPMHESVDKTLERVRNMMGRLIKNAESLKREKDVTSLEEVQRILQQDLDGEPLEAIVVC